MIGRPHKGTTLGFFLAILLVAAITVQWMNMYILSGSLQKKSNIIFPKISCSTECPQRVGYVHKIEHIPQSEECPDYFRWIHEDLKPWKATGITREMVERGREVAHIRVIVVKGVLYVEKYKHAFQTRDMVTLWGILQLLALYPGRIPDLDMMFECGDKPVIQKRAHDITKLGFALPPAFHYCSDEWSYDIVFPDWSFWGWPELKIKPWEILKKELQESNGVMKWEDREPYAYWKGNTKLGIARPDLVKCNVSAKQDWNARIYDVDWLHEKTQGFNTSDLGNQCTYRYKIYVEGVSWSVSEKYILACDSMSLIINPRYYDFFTRSLVPTVHYWPINEKEKCRSTKFAVDWGNSHPKEAQKIGKEGSRYVQENLRMKYVYDYMFHLLQEYAKHLKYQPSVREGAVEVCREALICSVKGLRKKFRLYSMVNNASESSPCTMPPHDDPPNLQAFLNRKHKLIEQVELWEATMHIRGRQNYEATS